MAVGITLRRVCRRGFVIGNRELRVEVVVRFFIPCSDFVTAKADVGS